MHAIQGAVAIRRERQKREQRRLSQIQRSSRRASSIRNGSQLSLVGNQADLEDPTATKAPKQPESSLTGFYLGVVFILLGFLMVFSSMVPSGVVDGAGWSNLLGVGTTFILVGLVMVMVNRIISQREEEELSKYVSHRLGRTRSGHALAKDLDVDERQRKNFSPNASGSLSRARPGSARRVGGGSVRRGSTRLRPPGASDSQRRKSATPSTASNSAPAQNGTALPLVTVTDSDRPNSPPVVVVIKSSSPPPASPGAEASTTAPLAAAEGLDVGEEDNSSSSTPQSAVRATTVVKIDNEGCARTSVKRSSSKRRKFFQQEFSSGEAG